MTIIICSNFWKCWATGSTESLQGSLYDLWDWLLHCQKGAMTTSTFTLLCTFDTYCAKHFQHMHNLSSCMHNLSSCIHNLSSCIHNLSSCIHNRMLYSVDPRTWDRGPEDPGPMDPNWHTNSTCINCSTGMHYGMDYEMDYEILCTVDGTLLF